MANHPNRSPKGRPDRNPSADEVRAAREAAGLDQLQAAKLIHVSVRSWIGWEAGEQMMHPAFFHFFLIMTRQRRVEDYDLSEQNEGRAMKATS